MKTERLTYRDIRDVVGLVAEVAELGLDPDRWRPHLLAGAMRLTRSDVGLTTDMVLATSPGPPRVVDGVDLGWATDGDRRRFFEYLADPDVGADPGMVAVLGAAGRGGLATAVRRQWVADDAWYAAPAVSELRRGAGVDDFLCSVLRPRPGAIHGLVVYRPWGGRAFDGHDRRVVRLLHAHVARLIRRGQRDPLTGRVAGLSPRPRQALAAVVEGLSDQEVADRMALSTHTVRDYVKAIFAATGTSSRAGLLAKMHRRPPGLVLPAPLRRGAGG